VFVFLPFNAIIDGFLVGLAVIVLVGLIDVIYQVRALYKILGQFLAAGVFTLISGKILVTMGGHVRHR
jgi:hypothetical protein